MNFNVSEQDVLRVRAEAASAGSTADLKKLPIEVGLQTETGYPHKGKLDYVSPTLNQSTGTLAVRGVLPNPDRVLLPEYFSGSAFPSTSRTERCWCRTSRWAATSPGVTCWW